MGINDEKYSNNCQCKLSQNDANFILKLFQAEAASNGDINLIYPMLAERQHLLNDRFTETLQQLTQMLIAEHPEAIESIIVTLGNLSNHISQFPRGKRANNIEIAITGNQIILDNLEPGSEKYARAQNNLAIAYYSRINGSRADNIEKAIEFYQAALTVRTFEDFPENWAITQNNLANAYSDRINDSRADNLERAIAYYTAALTIRTREAFPQNHT